MNKETWIFVGIASGAFVSALACYQYNTIKARKIEEQKVENEKLYFEKLTPEMVKELEAEKLQIKKADIALRNTEAELKKTVVDFKNDIKVDIESKVMDTIYSDMRDTFDNWAAKYEDRLDKKVDRVVSRIDDLSDKYGGVKAAGSSVPSISVVNAPNK